MSHGVLLKEFLKDYACRLMRFLMILSLIGCLFISF